jgi:hypothetical protein
VKRGHTGPVAPLSSPKQLPVQQQYSSTEADLLAEAARHRQRHLPLQTAVKREPNRVLRAGRVVSSRYRGLEWRCLAAVGSTIIRFER